MKLAFITTSQLIDELKRRSCMGVVYMENPDRDTEPESFSVWRWGSRNFQLRVASDLLSLLTHPQEQ